jgi:hypothetical protein
MSNKSNLTEALLIANGFQKSVNKTDKIFFSKKIPGTSPDFIIIKDDNGLFYAPQIQTPGELVNKMIALPGQNNLNSMDEVNLYYQRAIKALKG